MRPSLVSCSAALLLAALSAPAGADWTPNGIRPVGMLGQHSGLWNIADGHGGTFVNLRDYSDDPLGIDIGVRLQRTSANGLPATGWSADGLEVMPTSAAGISGSAVLNADGSITEGISNGQIYGQRIRSDGSIAPGWPASPTLLSATTTRLHGPIVGSIGDGDNLFLWDDELISSPTHTLYAQRLTATGAVAPGWPAGGLAIYVGAGARGIAGLQTPFPDGSGGALFAWSDYRNDGGIYALRIQGDGTPYPGWTAGGTTVCDTAGVQDICWFAPDGAGGLFVAWSDARAIPSDVPPDSWPIYTDIYLQHLTGSGQVAPGWPVNGRPICVWDGFQDLVQTVADGQGGAFLAWEGGGPQGPGIHAQHVRGDGALAPGWPEGGKQMFSANAYQQLPAITYDGAGGCWVSADISLPEPTTGIYHYKAFVQHVSGSGQFDGIWGAAGMQLATTYGDQTSTSICSDGVGGAYVGWEDARAEDEMYLQRVSLGGVVATQLSLAQQDVAPDHVTLAWQAADRSVAQATVEREDGVDGGWRTLATVTADGTGLLSYTDREVTPGARYGYRLSYDGGADRTAETWVEVPQSYRFALAGALGNPTRAGALRVRFTLARADAAELSLYDLTGRQVAARELGALGAGEHELALPEARAASPGVYWLRLREGAEQAVARVVLVGE